MNMKVTYEKIYEDLRGYIAIDFKDGDDLRLLISKQIDYFKKVSVTKQPAINIDEKDKLYIFSEKAWYVFETWAYIQHKGIGSVLALSKEYVYAEMDFSKFQEELETYILK